MSDSAWGRDQHFCTPAFWAGEEGRAAYRGLSGSQAETPWDLKGIAQCLLISRFFPVAHPLCLEPAGVTPRGGISCVPVSVGTLSIKYHHQPLL